MRAIEGAGPYRERNVPWRSVGDGALDVPLPRYMSNPKRGAIYNRDLEVAKPQVLTEGLLPALEIHKRYNPSVSLSLDSSPCTGEPFFSANPAAAEIDPGALRITSSARPQCLDLRGEGTRRWRAGSVFFPIFLTRNIEEKWRMAFPQRPVRS